MPECNATAPIHRERGPKVYTRCTVRAPPCTLQRCAFQTPDRNWTPLSVSGRAAFAAVAAVAKRFSFCGCYRCFCEHVLEKGVEDRGWELVPSNTVRDKNHVRWEAGLPSPYGLPPPVFQCKSERSWGGPNRITNTVQWDVVEKNTVVGALDSVHGVILWYQAVVRAVQCSAVHCTA